MAWSSSTILSTVELAIYAVLTQLVVFLAFRHRLNGILGHLLLTLFCTLRIVAGIIAIINRNDDPHRPALSSAIVSSIGLSPLILALSGFIHEAHHYQVTSSHTQTAARKLKRWLWIAQIQFHAVAIAGVALAASAAADLATATSQKDINIDNTKREAGSALLFALWIVLSFYTAFVWYKIRKTVGAARMSLSTLATCTLLSAVPIGIRTIYSFVFSVDHSPSINPVTGKFAVKLVLVFLVQLIAVAFLIAGSWVSRDIARSHPVSYAPVPAQGYPNQDDVELIAQNSQQRNK